MFLSFAALLLVPALACELPTANPPASQTEPEILSVRDLAEPGGPGLAPSRRALALAGKPVRMVGFMVRTEEPTAGGFWLASRPVECDEGGAGTGDLPPDAVRVVLRANRGEPVPHADGLLAVTGVLQVGNGIDANGDASVFRLVVEQRATLPAAKP